jgi:hypothetical protein
MENRIVTSVSQAMYGSLSRLSIANIDSLLTESGSSPSLCEVVRRKVQLHRTNASRAASPRIQDALSWLRSQGAFYASELGVPSGEGINPSEA